MSTSGKTSSRRRQSTTTELRATSRRSKQRDQKTTQAARRTSNKKRGQKVNTAAQRNSSRARGHKTTQAARYTNDKRHKLRSLLHRIDVRLPWLKLVAVCVLGLVLLMDLLDFTISKAQAPAGFAKIAPMSHHVRVSERILKGKKLVALTFDDGPSDATTPRLLQILHEKDVPATFFMLGSMIQRYPDLAQQAEKAGHVVGSHTMYHQNLVKIPTQAVQADLDEAKAVFKNTLDHSPALVRPPYGNSNDFVRSSTHAPLILWSVDTLDWKIQNTESIVSTTMSEVHDGAIILMHDIYPSTIDAIPVLIDTLRQNGYEFTTVPELAQIRNTKLVDGEIYYNLRPWLSLKE